MTGPVILVLLFSTSITLAELPDPDNCTVKENLPCELYEIKGFSSCAPDELETLFPIIFNNTANNPGRAFQFNASTFYKEHSPGTTFPGVTLTFTPPGDGSINFLKGFQLTRYRSDKPEDIQCYIYNMSAAIWSPAEDKNVVFTQTIFPIKPSTLYTYQLYTLPKPNPDGSNQYNQFRSVAVQAPAYAVPDNPGDWQTLIRVRVLHEYRTVLMDFDKANASIGFQKYKVTLYNAEEDTSNHTEVNDPHYTFENVSPGVYQVWVQPVDPYRSDFIKCLCKNAQNACDACYTTETANFTVKENVPVEEKTTMPPSTSEQTRLTSTAEPLKESDDTEVPAVKIIAAVLGTVIGLLLVGVVVLFYWYRCRPEAYDLTTKDVNDNENKGFDPEVSSVVTVDFLKKGGHLEKVNNFNANKVQFDRKKMFLLYEEDHQYHRIVVDMFATYLSQHCHCDVEQAELQHDAPWVHQDLAQADYVIIVNSEAAYKSYMSYNLGKNSTKSPSSSSINSIRNKFLAKEQYDHIIMVYFSYTDEKFILPDICPGYKYKLMKHFTDFLLHVHKLRRTDDLSHFDLPFDGNHNLRPIGQQLLESIDQAAQFESMNPYWYIQLHGMTRGMSNTSEESYLPSGDSGIPDDFSPGQTPDISPVTDPWTKSKYPENLLKQIDNKSVVTVTQSDLGLNDPYQNAIPKGPKQRAPLKLSPVSFKQQNIQEEPIVFTPPTDSPSDLGYDFIPPDLNSNFDAMSHTQSKQLENIVNQYTETLKDLGGLKGSKGPTDYDKEADLALLDAHSREIRFNSAMEGETISIGSGVSM